MGAASAGPVTEAAGDTNPNPRCGQLKGMNSSSSFPVSSILIALYSLSAMPKSHQFLVKVLQIQKVQRAVL